MSGSLSGPGASAPATISFDEISFDIFRPSTQIEIRPNYANIGLVGYQPCALQMGQMANGGTGRAGVAYQVFTAAQAASLWGAGSMLARQCKDFLYANTVTPLWGIGQVAPAGAAPASGTITVQYAATASGNMPFAVAGTQYNVPAALGATAAAVAAALTAQVNADASSLVTAAAAAGVVTFTAKSGGEWGNAIPLAYGVRGDEMVPPGLGVYVTPMAGGAGVPDILATLSAIATEWYTDIGVGWTDETTRAACEAEGDVRYSATGRRDAHFYMGLQNTVAEALYNGPRSNSRFLTRLPQDGSASAPWSWAAVISAVSAFQLGNDPARQLRSLSLPGLFAPPSNRRYLDAQQEQLLRNGMSTFNVLTDGTVTLQRVITSNQTNALGIPDRAWLDIMAPKTYSRIRYDFASYLGLLYPRHKLADDDSPAAEFSDVVATPRRVHNSWAARSQLYERLAWIEKAAESAAASTFIRNLNDPNRMDARLRVRRIGNLMVFSGRLEFAA